MRFCERPQCASQVTERAAAAGVGRASLESKLNGSQPLLDALLIQLDALDSQEGSLSNLHRECRVLHATGSLWLKPNSLNSRHLNGRI